MILHVNHIDCAAHAVAAAFRYAAGNGNAEVIHIVFGLLHEAAANAELTGGLGTGDVCGTHAVGNGTDSQADTHLGGAHIQGARNQSGIGIILCQDFGVAAYCDDIICIFQLADVSLHFIAVEQHCEGTGKGCSRRAGRRYDGTADGFCIIINGGQEVQQINGINKLFGAHVDAYIVLAVSALVDIQDALLGCCFLLGSQTGGIGHDQGLVQRQGKIRIGNLVLDGIDLQVAGTDNRLGTVFDEGQNLIFRINQRKGRADTDGSSLTVTDAACTDCQLGLIGCCDLQITAGLDHTALGGRSLGQRLGCQDRERTADGCLAVGSGNAACQRLGAQSSSVDAVHIGCVNCRNDNISGNIFLSGFCIAVRFRGGDNGTGVFCNSFVIVDGNCNTGCHSEGRSGKGHSCRIGTGPEVCIVLRMEHHILGSQAAADKGVCLMLCDVDADRGGNLGSIAFIRNTGTACGTSGDVRILLICSIRHAGSCQAASIADSLGGAGLCVGIIGQVVVTVSDSLCSSCTVIDSVQISLDVGTHCGSSTKCIVRIVGTGCNFCSARGIYSTCHPGLDVRISIVDCGTCTDCCLAASAESTGGSQGVAFLLRHHIDGNQFLLLCLVDHGLDLCFGQILGQGCAVAFLVESADIQIALLGVYSGTFRNIGIYLVVNKADGHCCVQANIHDLIFRDGAVAHCQRIGAGHSIGLQIILKHGYHAEGACGDNTVFADGCHSLCMLAAVDIVKCEASTHTDSGTGLCLGGLGDCAGIHRTDGSSGGHDDLHGDLCIGIDTVLIDFRNQEGIGLGSNRIQDILLGIGLLVGCSSFLGLDLYFLGDIAGGRIGQQNVIHIICGSCTAVGCSRNFRLDLDRDLGAGLDRLAADGIDLGVHRFALGIGGRGCLFNRKGCAGGLVGGQGGSSRTAGSLIAACIAAGTLVAASALGNHSALNLQLGIQNLAEGNIDGHGSTRCCTCARYRNSLIQGELILTVGKGNFNRSGSGCLTVGGCCGSGNGVCNLANLEVSIGCNHQCIGRLIVSSSYDIHFVDDAVGCFRNRNDTVVPVGSGINGARCRCRRRIAAGRIRISFAVSVDCRGGNGIFILLALGTDHQTICYGNVLDFFGFLDLFCIHDACHGLNIDHSNGQAAGHTDVGCTGTGDGMGTEGMGRVFLCGHNLCIDRIGKGSQHNIGRCLAGRIQSIDERCLDILTKACIDKRLELRNIDEVTQHLVCEILQCCEGQCAHILQRILLLGGQLIDDALNRAGGSCTGGIGVGICAVGCTIVGLGCTGDIHRAGQLIGCGLQRSTAQRGQPVQQISDQNIFQRVHGCIAEFFTKAVKEILGLCNNIVRYQFLQACMGQHGLNELCCGAGNQISHKILKTFQNTVGSGIQRTEDAVDDTGNSRSDQEFKNIDVLVCLLCSDCQHLLVGTVIIHFGNQLNAVSLDRSLTDDRSVDGIHNVDGHSNTDTDVRTDCARVGINSCIGIIVGGNFQLAGQIQNDSVGDDRFIDVFLNIQVESCCNLDACFILRIGIGAGIGHGLDLVAAETTVTCIGQIGGLSYGIIRLRIRRTTWGRPRAVTACGTVVRRRCALGAGTGSRSQIGTSGGGDLQVVALVRIIDLCTGGIIQNRNGKGTAKAHIAAHRRSIGRDLTIDKAVGQDCTIHCIDQIVLVGPAQNRFVGDGRNHKRQNGSDGDTAGRTGLGIHDLCVSGLSGDFKLLKLCIRCLSQIHTFTKLSYRVNTDDCHCNTGTDTCLGAFRSIGIAAFRNGIEIGLALGIQNQISASNGDDRILLDLCISLSTGHMDSNSTCHTEVTGRIACQRCCAGADLFGSLGCQYDAVSIDDTSGNGCFVGMLGNGHIYTDASGEGLCIGGSGSACIGGKLTGDGDRCCLGGFVVSNQGLACRQILCQCVLINTVSVQTQGVCLFRSVSKLEGDLQRVGYQTVAGVGGDRHINVFTQVCCRSHTDHTAGGLSHIGFGLRIGCGSRCGIGRTVGGGGHSGFGCCRCADLVILFSTKCILDAKANQIQLVGRTSLFKFFSVGQIRQIEAVDTVAVIGNGNLQIQLLLRGLISGSEMTVGFHSDGDLLAVVVCLLGKMQNHSVLAVGSTCHSGVLLSVSVCISNGIIFADAQVAVQRIHNCVFAAGCGIKNIQLDTLGFKLQADVVSRHYEGETTGAVEGYIQIFGHTIFHIADNQLDVITGHSLIIIQLTGCTVEVALLDGVNHHRTAASGLGITVTVGTGTAADLIAVLGLCLACRSRGSGNGIVVGCIFGIDIDLTLGKNAGSRGIAGIRLIHQREALLGNLLIVRSELIQQNIGTDLFCYRAACRFSHISVPYLINIVSFPCSQIECDLLVVAAALILVVAVTFIGRRAVEHLIEHNCDLRMLFIRSVTLYLLCSNLILNGSTAIVDVDVGGCLGIPVNGRSIRQRFGLGRSVGIQCHSSACSYKAVSHNAVGIGEGIAQRNVCLVIVLYKRNCHGANQLTAVLAGCTGGTHIGGLGLAGGCCLLAEGRGDLCICCDHSENILSVVIGMDFFCDTASVHGLDDDQLFHLITICRLQIYQNLLTVLCILGIDAYRTGNDLCRCTVLTGGRNLFHWSRGDLEDVLIAGFFLLGIFRSLEGIGTAAAGSIGRTLDACTAVDFSGAQSQRLLTAIQFSECNCQFNRRIRHDKCKICGSGSSLACSRNCNNRHETAGCLIGVADDCSIDRIAAVRNCTNGNRVALVCLDRSGNGAVNCFTGVDLQVAALDLIDALTQKAHQLVHAQIGQNLIIGVFLNHAQDTGHHAGDGIQVHCLLLTVGALHGSLSQSPGLFNGLAVDIDVSARCQLGCFGNQRSAVLQYHRHSEETAEAEAAVLRRCRRLHHSTGIAGAIVDCQHFSGRIFLRNGCNIGISICQKIDVSAGRNHTVNSGARIHGDNAQCQSHRNHTDCGHGRGCHLRLAGQLCRTAGGNHTGVAHIRIGICRDNNHRQRQTELLIEIIVGLDINSGGAFRFHSSASRQAAVNADFCQTNLNHQGEGNIDQAAQIEIEDGLSLNTGCRQENIILRIQCSALCHTDQGIGFEIKIPEVQIDVRICILHGRCSERTFLGKRIAVIVTCIDNNAVSADVTVDGDLLAVDFQIQTGDIHAAQFQFVTADFQLCEIQLGVLAGTQGQRITVQKITGEYIVGEGTANHDVAAFSDVIFRDYSGGLTFQTVCQSIDLGCVDGDDLSCLAGSLNDKIVVNNYFTYADGFLCNLVVVAAVDLTAQSQNIIVLVAADIQAGDSIGGIQIHIDAVRAGTHVQCHTGILAAGLCRADTYSIIAFTAVEGDLNFFIAGQFDRHIIRTLTGADFMITGSLEGYIDRIVTFTGADFGFSGSAAGVGNRIIVLGAVNGNTGIALCLHKTVDGEIQTSHDQFKILGCIDLNISVHSGNAFALGSYRCLVDDLTLSRCCIGVFRQDVEFKTVVQIICHITCRIYNNIAVIFTGTNHDGDVFAVRGSSGKCFLNSLIDGIVRGCLSGSDKGIIRCILRGIVVLSLQ